MSLRGLVAVGLVGCGAPSPASTVVELAPRQEAAGSAAAHAPSAPTPAPSAPTPAADPALCVTAYDDQAVLYAGAEATIHPARRERFLHLCAQLPLQRQRCASPLYAVEDRTPCDTDEATDRATGAVWSELFGLLSGTPEELARPPVTP